MSNTTKAATTKGTSILIQRDNNTNVLAIYIILKNGKTNPINDLTAIFNTLEIYTFPTFGDRDVKTMRAILTKGATINFCYKYRVLTKLTNDIKDYFEVFSNSPDTSLLSFKLSIQNYTDFHKNDPVPVKPKSKISAGSQKRVKKNTKVDLSGGMSIQQNQPPINQQVSNPIMPNAQVQNTQVLNTQAPNIQPLIPNQQVQNTQVSNTQLPNMQPLIPNQQVQNTQQDEEEDDNDQEKPVIKKKGNRRKTSNIEIK
jgi:hypothetical protein